MRVPAKMAAVPLPWWTSQSTVMAVRILSSRCMTADGHRHVVDHAKSFTMIGEGMVEATANVDGNAIFKSVLGGQNRTTCGQPEGSHQLRRVGNFHLLLFARRERSGFEFLHILRSVDEQDVLVRCRLRSHEVGRFGNMVLEQLVMDSPIFVGTERRGSPIGRK